MSETEGQMPVDAWHYQDERSGKRIGPVDREKITKLIGQDRINRATLVWHPAMPEWAKASQSGLSGLFGDRPPPLTATEIRRGAMYTLALFPLWGLAIQAVLCAAYAGRLGLTPRDMFESLAWLLAFVAGNTVLSAWDEHNLHKGGLTTRAAFLLGGLLVPFYILASCRAFQRHSRGSAWLAYLPFLLWMLAIAGAIFVDPLVFNPDAPLVLNPDQWL